MKSRDFCYWLQGYFEVGGNVTLTPDQIEIIKRHLSMVFKTEIDPSFGEELQDTLNQAHSNQSDQILRC